MLRNIHEEIRIIFRAVIFISTSCAFMFNFVEYFLLLRAIFVVIVAFYAFFARSFRNISLALTCTCRERRQRAAESVKHNTPIEYTIHADVYMEVYIYLHIYLQMCVHVYQRRLRRAEIMIFCCQKGLNLRLQELWAVLYMVVYVCAYVCKYVCVHFMFLTTRLAPSRCHKYESLLLLQFVAYTTTFAVFVAIVVVVIVCVCI